MWVSMGGDHGDHTISKKYTMVGPVCAASSHYNEDGESIHIGGDPPGRPHVVRATPFWGTHDILGPLWASYQKLM